MQQNNLKPHVGAVVEEVITGLPDGVLDAPRRTVTEGSAHVVVLIEGHAAVRVTRDRDTGQQLRKRQALVDAIPSDFAFEVPRSLGEVAEVDGYSGVATQLLSGEPCAVNEGSTEELSKLLDAVSSLDTARFGALLAEPLSFCGGNDWYRIQVDEVLPRLDRDARPIALKAVEALAGLGETDQVFSHGDLGGHNVMWKDGKVTGILDWDLSAKSGRHTDLATLGVWHGWHKLAEIASPQLVKEAAIARDTFRLQQVAFSIISGRSESEIMASAERASEWIRKNLQ